MINFFLPTEDHPPFRQLPSPGDEISAPRLFLSPAVNWVWRTHYHLSKAGFACKLVETIPSQGIVVTAACNTSIFYRPNRDQFIVSCVADSPPRFYPQVQVFQSASQALNNPCHRRGDQFPISKYMPHWPQPDLIGRDIDRGDRFENIDYFGAPEQLDQSIQTPDFRNKLASLGLNLRFHFKHYHDYRETDAVLAVRNFASTPVTHKPASKLINAWRAGTPALLGKESAYRELKESNDDYIEVGSPHDILSQCDYLKKNPAKRATMAQRGRDRTSEFSEESITWRWRKFLENEVLPAANQWFGKSPTSHLIFQSRQTARRAFVSFRRRLSRDSTHF